jgi:hypothetical protein
MAGGHESGHGHGHGGAAIEHDLLERMGYETRDVDTATILRWLGVLFALIIVTIVATLGLYNFFVPADLIAQTRGHSRPSRAPAQPQVQVLPRRDMKAYRQAEEVAAAGGVTTKDGRQTIPVDAAIDRLAAQGISGVRGTQLPAPGRSYPGSGIYEEGPAAGSEPHVPATPPGPAAGGGGAPAATAAPDLRNVPSAGAAAPAANTENQQFRMMYGGEQQR